MKAVVFLGDRKIDFMEFPDPTPGPGEAVIEIKASGMCGSDLKMYRAKGGAAALGLVGDGSPLVAGHEPCGVMVAVGEGRRPGYGSALQRLRGLQRPRRVRLQPRQDRRGLLPDQAAADRVREDRSSGLGQGARRRRPFDVG